jgi:hypothetical protein
MHRLRPDHAQAEDEHPLTPAFAEFDANRAARDAGPTRSDFAVTVHTVPLPGGRRLHLALTHDAAGAPDELVIAAGYQDANPLYVLSGGVNLPASALPDLRDALAALHTES